MRVVISGIGTANPPYYAEQNEAAQAAAQYCATTPDQAEMMGVLYRMSGIHSRSSVLLGSQDGDLVKRQTLFPDFDPAVPAGPSTEQRLDVFAEKAGPLALEASRSALENSGVKPESITHLITVTCSGFIAPGFDFALINGLPLRPDVARTQIGFMGCHAALNAIRVAHAYAAADPDAVVLVCCVEICSVHFQYGWSPEQIVANSLFGDGAAACVVHSEKSQKAISDRNGHSKPLPAISRIVANGSMMLPNSADAMSWRIGNNGFRMTLSTAVPKLLSIHVKPWLESWLSKFNLTPEQIQTWAVHPGGPRILNTFAESLSCAPEALDVSREVLQKHGNMSSPTVLFVLDRVRQLDRKGPCVAIGFGPGLVAEAALLD